MRDLLAYNPIFLIFTSFLIGALLTEICKKLDIISYFLNMDFLSDEQTKQLGILKFRWILMHSFMSKFNQKLKYDGKAKKLKLEGLVTEMNYAEISHFFAFLFLLVINILFFWWNINWAYIVFFFFINVVFNLFFVFIQQYNKRRIRRILQKM
ncbi:MAG: hypothetical protein CMO01_04440 [Thalassobius sp.]|nr:hypothetical protein [Thalassovita sp.]